ncbi:uncharacterized protein Osi2 [Atheta coriaria]|uniref:uncharacterized protein Osi2 n=1 Tax=Dalotia coriaria TaxID=877792 RepID=UPI0031F44FB9
MPRRAVICLCLLLVHALPPSNGQQVVSDGVEDERQGRNLLDWIGLGTGGNNDPYLSRANAACLNGDLAECFKSRALNTFDEFFDATKDSVQLTESAKVVRMPDNQLRAIEREPFEFSQMPRADEPEWDQLVKFVMRKVEKFMKSTALEISVDNEVTEHGRYTPRFVDEIADEIDVIEDKRDTLFNRKQLKKLFIPLLLVLKIFKLKLLLFLPLILGLASFKKFLGFLAIVIPGAIAYFKLCKPDFQSAFGGFPHHQVPQYSPAGIGFHPHHFRENSYAHTEYPSVPDYAGLYEGGHYASSGYHNKGGGGGGFAFKDSSAQNLAYSGYQRSNEKDIQAVETTSKKSILPSSK